MRTMLAVFSCYLMFTALACQPSGTRESSGTSGVERVYTGAGALEKASDQAVYAPELALESWIEMWNSYDLDMVDELFVTGDNVTYLSSEKEGVIVGMDALREHHVGFGFVPGGKEQPNRLWVENLHASVFGSTKIVTGTWFFSRGSDEETDPQRGPFTAVLVRDGNEDRIAHMHFANYE